PALGGPAGEDAARSVALAGGAEPCGPVPPCGPSCAVTRRACSAEDEPPVPPPDPRRAPMATAPVTIVPRLLLPAVASTAPVVQVKNFIRAGRASSDMSTIANPMSVDRGSRPLP